MQKKNKKLHQIRACLIAETKNKLRKSVSDDNLIIHTIHNIEELQRTANLLSKRLREWYSLYNPEFTKAFDDNRKFSELIVKKGKKELLFEIGIKTSESMGADIGKKDLEQILKLACQINSVYSLINSHEAYLESVMNKRCPSLNALIGHLIGAKLIAHAGSLKHLASMTASTIQLLGAEKALFRHLRTGAKSPKHGLIIKHPMVASAKQSLKGKAARALADKASIAARVDYFKGKPIGAQLKKELEKKLLLSSAG